MPPPIADSERPLRVMQSFGPPRSTSNPYIHMLDAALSETEGLEHHRFDRVRALMGRYDAIQFHWPETLLGGATPLKRTARRLYASALMVRLAVDRRIAVIRTEHNVDLPSDIGAWERRILQYVERRTDFRIRLNEDTKSYSNEPGTVIPHGHYREWFRDVEASPTAAHSLGFVGLVRRYKGVENLIEAFAQTARSRPEARLVIAGNPTSKELAAEVRALAAADGRVRLDLRYLTEDEFARAVTAVQGIVLPYRFMHNSGTALAALSLERPVLVPRNAVNTALDAEVGEGWVHQYDGDLTDDHLAAFYDALQRERAAPPDLSARNWDRAGAEHLRAFREAVRLRRGRRAR